MRNGPGEDDQDPDDPPPDEFPIEHQRGRDTQHDTSDNSPAREDDRDPNCVPRVGISQDGPVVLEGQAGVEPEPDHPAVGQADPEAPD